jgi:hypothetical protein
MHRYALLLAAGVAAAAAAPGAFAQATINRTQSAAASSFSATRTPSQAGRVPVRPDGSVGFTGTLPSISGSSGSPGATGTGGAFVPGAGTPAVIGVGGGTVPVEVVNGPNTAVLGAGATVPGPTQYLNSGAGGFSAIDIAKSFYIADANHDGVLTEAEARRLTIQSQSFQQMDRDFDGTISRAEYEESLQ